MDAKQFQSMVSPIVRSRKKFSKIFCIGYNKTGTTSVEALLRLYGYKLPNQQQQEIELTKQVFSGNYRPLREFVSDYDAFQDLPFSQGHIYIVADCLFPGSKFILTERDPDDWFSSLCRFHSKVFGISDLRSLTENDVKQRFNYLYPGYSYENIQRMLTVMEGGVPRVRWDLLYDGDFYK